MIVRHAAALLCGAAAVHLTDLLFHAGIVEGWSGQGRGRALLLLAAAAPATWLAAVMWDRRVGFWAFLGGACAGYAADEWWLLPAFGWTWTTALWVIPAGAALRFRPADRPAPATPSRRIPVAMLAGAMVLGVACGFAFAVVRPFLLQHVNGTRQGLRIAVVTGLAGLLAGAALGLALKRRLPAWALATLGAVLAPVAALTTGTLLFRSRAGLSLPFLGAEWTTTWWGRSFAASWAGLGLMTVALGLVFPLLDRRLALPFVIGGICAGTWLGEERIAALGARPDALRTLADDVACHPPLQPVTAAAIDPDGLWTRYRTRTLLELESIGYWQGTRMERGNLWENLERAEAEPAGGALSIRGHAPGDDALWSGGAARPSGHRVLRSFAWLASGLSIDHTVERLSEERNGAPGSLRVWCDPRALTPAGLESLLATWREALPDGRLLVLADGYSGPLLGVRAGGEGLSFPVADQLAIFEAPIASALRGPAGRPSTTDRPVLEWESAPEPSPFIHPTADVMRVLAERLAVEPGSPVARLLRSLVIHAEAQVVRPYVVSAWDHVAVPEAELDELMEGFRIDPDSPVILRHLQIVLDVLLAKREYALLVRHAEEAVARKPEAAGFHRTLGRAYHDILDFGNAVEELELARSLDPRDHDLAMELSRALGAAGRWPEAVALLEDQRRARSDAAVEKGLAIALLESGDLARAEPMLRDLRARYPADLDLMRALDRLESRPGK